ncbi:MAG: hypothetical protein ABI660_19760 [Polaromonas sp.]
MQLEKTGKFVEQTGSVNFFHMAFFCQNPTGTRHRIKLFELNVEYFCYIALH